MEHRDKRLFLHISKVEKCPSAPWEVRREAWVIMASVVGGGTVEPATSAPGPSSSGTQEDPIDLASGGENKGTPAKKKKIGGNADIKSFLDRPLSENEKKQADQYLVRYESMMGLLCSY